MADPAGSGAHIDSLESSVFVIPTDHPEADGTLAWDKTTMVLAEVKGGGSSGLGWTYASGACKAVMDEVLADAVSGVDAADVPRALEAMVRACRNLGRPGIVACAISAVETALSDLKAKLLGVPLCSLFGRARVEVQIYGSGGFTTYSDPVARSQLETWVGDWSIPRVKIKIAESWGTCVERDLACVAFARSVIGDDVELYV
ncbi:MAG: enolase C-terminal domain-like protein, partial [Acidimicrobiales bacterium]